MLQRAEIKRERIGSALAVAALHALLAYFFLTGLGVVPRAPLPDALKLFDAKELPPPPPKPPPPQPQPRKAKPKEEEGAAAPPNLRATPSEVVAPKPVIPLPVPPPVLPAPVAGPGAAPSAGAAPVPGPGTGAGGVGNGLGSGLSGNGTGGGGGGGIATHVRLLRGGIDGRDYPPRAYEAGETGTTYMRFTVTRSGRARDCVVTRSSGHRDLDAVTCELILRRFLYRPARDAEGRLVEEEVRGQQDWEIGRRRRDDYEDEDER
ncbi:MAG: TonB family protein [Allosphingosinicella sp.]